MNGSEKVKFEITSVYKSSGMPIAENKSLAKSHKKTDRPIVRTSKAKQTEQIVLYSD